MSIIFDGRKFAQERELKLADKCHELKARGIVPKLVSFLIGGDAGSRLYLNLKRQAAERIGAKLEVIELDPALSLAKVQEKIRQANTDPAVHGVMLQLPVEGKLKTHTQDLIDAIAPEKDVDGMRDGSLFVAPVVRAVDEIFYIGEENIHLKVGEYPGKLVIVGANGFVGKRLVKHFLKAINSYQTIGVDMGTSDFVAQVRSADIVISVTGQAGLITAEMVKEGAVLIDVGAPVGDIQKEAYAKAAFVSPVPGGVGPMTIAFLLENLVDSLE